jgi:hypothetical protein
MADGGIACQDGSPELRAAARAVDDSNENEQAKRSRNPGVDDICGQLQYLAAIVAETAKGQLDGYG